MSSSKIWNGPPMEPGKNAGFPSIGKRGVFTEDNLYFKRDREQLRRVGLINGCNKR